MNFSFRKAPRDSALLLAAIACCGTYARAQPSPQLDDLQRLFAEPPDDARIMMRWWWFGPAVTRPELQRELQVMKEGGIGGVEVQPVYPVELDDPATGIKNLPFLSDAFLDALAFAGNQARELGLRFDLTLGSGWPYGGPQVPIHRAAGKLRVERSTLVSGSGRLMVPSISSGERLIAVFVRIASADAGPSDWRELTAIEDGIVHFPSDLQGPREVLFFIASRTGMMVKRAAIGAEGFVLDHYDRGAIDGYLKSVGGPLLRALEPNLPHAIFCDSLEVYESDWTDDFLDQFQRRRGYDLKPHLPRLATGVDQQAAAIRHDWGQTLTELLNERFVAPLQQWAQRNHTLLRLQAYGTPPASLSTNRLADLSEGEGFQWKTLSATRWASSASHLYGRPITSSETWTWLHSPSFRATPLDMKAEADLHFLQGINQLIGHGWPYSPQGVDYPGWRFYAAGVFSDKNPWWIAMPDLARYLQRVSFMLRQGSPVNDVALYLPTSDAWAHFSLGRVSLIEALRDRLGPDLIGAIVETGLGFDVFDDEALRALGRVEGNTLRLGPNVYRAVVLPGVERMPLDTLRTLETFARGGGALIATRRLPELAPGFRATEAEHAEVRERSRRLFQAAAGGHFVANEGADLGRALIARVQPDIALSPAVPDIGIVHRHSDLAEIYFVANTANERRRADATIRLDDLNGEWWDPLNGRVREAITVSQKPGGTTISLDLEPYGSRVLVFSRRARPRRSAAPPGVSTSISIPKSLDISNGWTVSFPGASKRVVMDHLRSWTDDERTRYFSGVATYEREIAVPSALLARGLALRLDFGQGQALQPEPKRSGMQAWLESPIRDAAVVYINDRRVGSVWCPPYTIDVTGVLKRGSNRIRILVGNLAINHMAGHALPNYRLLSSRYGVRFAPQDMDKLQPVPAGLLGAVRLTADLASDAVRDEIK